MVRIWLQLIGWLACAVYSTIPAFWLMIHPFAERWRARRRSPYLVLLPAWFTMWFIVALASGPWIDVTFYSTAWSWIPAALLFATGLFLYAKSGKSFSAKQLGGLPEVHGRNRDQRLVTDGIRARVRHPVYLAHLCEMLAWSIGTGLAVCLGADGVCPDHWRIDDQDGRCGVGKAVWGFVSRLSRFGTNGVPADVYRAPDIIRLN
jgi:protein-S-isoprenylcysteine O-methyltransferase Ste14